MLKYLFTLFINLCLLIFSLYLWTNNCTSLYGFALFNEIFKLGGLSLLLMISFLFTNALMRIRFLNKYLKNNKLYYLILITALITGFKHSQYLYKNIRNWTLAKEIASTCSKIEKRSEMFIKAQYLTKQEFDLLHEGMAFPFFNLELPNESFDISLDFYYDILPPNFHFFISYKAPMNVFVEEINIKEKRYTKSQSFKIEKGLKTVSYSESKY